MTSPSRDSCAGGGSVLDARRFAIHAHVIHEQTLRCHILRRQVGRIEPSTHGEVQNDEERVAVERPVGRLHVVRLVDRLKQHVVHIPADLLRLPFHREDVPFPMKVAGGKLVLSRGDQVAVGNGTSVQRSGRPARQPPFALHDVDFAARGPPDLVDVPAQHPKGRPHADHGGQAHAGLEAAVEKLPLALRVDTCRGVVAMLELLAPSLDDQDTVLEPHVGTRRVVGTIRVVLELLVVRIGHHHDVPAVTIEPLAVEFVLPDQRPAARRRSLGDAAPLS
jgi:hypothetical protein